MGSDIHSPRIAETQGIKAVGGGARHNGGRAGAPGRRSISSAGDGVMSAVAEETARNPAPYATSEVVEMTGATFRQLDHWSRRGYVRPLNPTSGSGVQRQWSPLDIRVARALLSVSKLGTKSELIFRAASAAIYRAGDKPNARWLMVYCDGDDPYGLVRPHPLTSADMPVWVCPLPPLDDPEAL
jgi:hypothetical protein